MGEVHSQRVLLALTQAGLPRGGQLPAGAKNAMRA